jgi:hypothetical protein
MRVRMVCSNTLRRASVAALFFAGALVARPAAASDVGWSKNFGVGLVVGYPDVGLSFNYFMSRSLSLQIDPALHFDNGKDNDHLAIGGRGDLLFWMPELGAWSAADLCWYWGPGVNFGLGLGDHGGFGLGAELPVGIGLRFNNVPIDLNLEGVPILHIIDHVAFGIGVALNARYYF